MKKNKFYVTTPLYYVNSNPHLGHAYTNVISDVTARFHKMINSDTYFLTGTDEHGQKILKAALKEDIPVTKFTDRMVSNFDKLWNSLHINYNDFIRTTENRHLETVKKALTYLHNKEDIYESIYEGFYCVPCESFWDKTQIKENKCPDCGREVGFIKEKNYFFKLSKYQQWLFEYIKDNPSFIRPKTRYNEVYSFLENNTLRDLCISRPKDRLKWGIELPFDNNYVTYVWFDALLNYISAVDAFVDDEKFKKYWPADVHFIGKDILRQHAIYWPVMLKALDMQPPKCVFAHGWWMLEKDDKIEKMSKSKNNVVSPSKLVEEFGLDAFRFFLLREIPLGADGNFSYKAIVQRINSDLANDFGNLVFRTSNMIYKYYKGLIPANKKQIPAEHKKMVEELPAKYLDLMKRYDFCSALEKVWELIKAANKSIEKTKPWILSREQKTEQLADFMYFLAETIRVINIYISPFMPQAYRQINEQFGIVKDAEAIDFQEDIKWGQLTNTAQIKKGKPLFPRIG